MNTRIIMLRVIFGMILGFTASCGIGYLNKQMGLPNDNPVEQEIEQVIEQETGVSIDLTP